MQRANHTRGKWWNVVFSLTALLVVVADQLSKIWIRSYPEGQPIFEARFFRLIHIHNSGAAFGLFQDHSFTLAIVDIVGIAIILLAVLVFSRRFSLLDNRLGKPALGLVLGGTLGNLADRLHLGFVTDFIDIGDWPTFNIADSAITLGVILFACSLLSSVRASKH